MRFRWFTQKSTFDSELNQGNIDVGDICFILDRLRIYTRSSNFDFSNRPIYQGETSTSDSVGAWTVTIDGITELYDGLTVKVKITTEQGSSYSTLNVNNLGANPVWFGYSVPLTSSTPLALNQEVILTYRTTASASGIEIGGTSYTRGWVMSDSLKTTIGQGLAVSNGALGLNYGSVTTGNTTLPVTGSEVYNEIPHTYIKSASVSNSTLTLTTQSDSPINFEPSYDYSEIVYDVATEADNGNTAGIVTIDGTKPLTVLTLTGDVSSLDLASGKTPEAGHSAHVIMYSASACNVSIAHDVTVRVCPKGSDGMSISIVAGGYAEVDFLNAGGKIFVRGV